MGCWSADWSRIKCSQERRKKTSNTGLIGRLKVVWRFREMGTKVTEEPVKQNRIEPFQRETESTLRKHRTWGRNILMDAQPCGLSTFLLVKNLECLFQVWPWTSDCGHQTPLVLPPTPSPHILETSHQTQWSRVSWAPYIMCHIRWASQGQRWFWVLQLEQWPDKWRKE